VFVNLEDFGRGFAQKRNAVPNTYGPIIVRLDPRALCDAVDIAVCLRSAGARGFDRQAESLKSLAELDQVFYDPIESEGAGPRLKFRDGLKATFGAAAEAVEVSCTVPGGVLSWKHAVEVVVDPYTIDGRQLVHYVQHAVNRYGSTLRVRERPSFKRPHGYNRLMAAVRERTPSPADLARTIGDDDLRAWAETIAARGGILEWNFIRYADYLRAGTLDRLAAKRARQRPVIEYAAIAGEDEADWTEDEYDTWEEERDLLLAEMDEDRMSYHRSEQEGWFYDDDEDEDDWSSEDDEDLWE
jgi:hypothetical protein